MRFTKARILNAKEEIIKIISKIKEHLKTIVIIALLIYATVVTLYGIDLTEAYKNLSIEKDELQNEYLDLEKEYFTLQEEFNYISDQIDPLNEVIDELDRQNSSLIDSNNEYYAKLQIFYEREELFDKYEYAIIDDENKRTDITYDRLKTAESLCKEKGVDIDYLLSTIMVESGGNETAKNKESTATGFGQLLKGTGTYVYETIMENGKGTYDHSMALDGDINLEMTVEYMAYLQDNNPNLHMVIEDYRGMKDDAYVSEINQYLRPKGKSVDTITF